MTSKIKYAVTSVFLISFYGLLVGCAGTLGGIGEKYYFPVSKNMLTKAVATLMTEHPKYQVPENWQRFDDWSARGYDFLDSDIFYFSSQPQEMYYLSFIGDEESWKADSSKISIAIRAINVGDSRWFLADDLNHSERNRIADRFEAEIVSKLEKILRKKSWKE